MLQSSFFYHFQPWVPDSLWWSIKFFEFFSDPTFSVFLKRFLRIYLINSPLLRPSQQLCRRNIPWTSLQEEVRISVFLKWIASSHRIVGLFLTFQLAFAHRHALYQAKFQLTHQRQKTKQWERTSGLVTMGGGASVLSSEDFVTMSQNLKEEYELLISSGYTDEEIRTRLIEKYHEQFLGSTSSEVVCSEDGTDASTMIKSEGPILKSLPSYDRLKSLDLN